MFRISYCICSVTDSYRKFNMYLLIGMVMIRVHVHFIRRFLMWQCASLVFNCSIYGAQLGKKIFGPCIYLNFIQYIKLYLVSIANFFFYSTCKCLRKSKLLIIITLQLQFFFFWVYPSRCTSGQRMSLRQDLDSI